tara:strand:+ start:149 stop:265 length:117 start_codon:yes stop_codon:yes gene_type:complete
MLNDRLQNTIDKLLERAIESKTKTPIQEKKSTLKGFLI